FDQYLRHTALPTLELSIDGGTLSYRWKADEPAFAMPIRIGSHGTWQSIEPTTTWKTLRTPLRLEDVEIQADQYYVNVAKQPPLGTASSRTAVPAAAQSLDGIWRTQGYGYVFHVRADGWK